MIAELLTVRAVVAGAIVGLGAATWMLGRLFDQLARRSDHD